MKKGFLIGLLALIPLNVSANSKEEIVYSNMDYYGNVKSVSTTSHIVNGSKDEIVDYSYLRDIVNLNGKEKFSITNGENGLSKVAISGNGRDIFYRGSSDRVTPITSEIEYFLDGEKIDVKDMTGKSGHVVITVKLNNNEKTTINVGGQNLNAYVPFVSSVMMVLDSDNSNVSVSNGKCINTGNRTIAMGLGSAGLYESSGIEEFKDLDVVKFEFDTEGFEFSDIYIVSKAKLLEDDDLRVFDKLDTLVSSSNSLKSNMDLIVKSTEDLYAGAKGLKSASGTINEKVGVVLNYMNEILEGTISLDDGVKGSLQELDGIKEMLNSSSDSESIQSMISLIGLDEDAIRALESTNSELAPIYEGRGLANLDYSEITDSSLVTVKKTYEGNVNMINLLNGNIGALNGSLAKFNEINEKVNGIMEMLNSKLSYMSDGTGKLREGVSRLRDGISELYSGTSLFDSKMSELTSGTDRLNVGTHQYSESGIDTLYNYSMTVKEYGEKLEALVELSNGYKGYSADNCDSSLFIGLVKASNSK